MRRSPSPKPSVASSPIPRVFAIPAILALAWPAAGRANAQPTTDRLTLDRYLQMETVSDPRLSPDGREVAYVREWIDVMSDARKSAIWIVNADGSRGRYLTEGTSPRWSPSGERLAFLACGTPGGDRSALTDCAPGAHQQIYVRIMAGDGSGAITQVTRLTEDASNIHWSPDARQVAFTQFVPEQGGWRLDLPGKPEGATWTDEPRVIDQADYRQDRRGFDRHGSVHIFVVPAEGGTPRRLTQGPHDHGAPQWSPDGQTVYFDGYRHEDVDRTWYAGSYLGRPSRIYALDLDTREILELRDHEATDEQPVVSPDGMLVAFLSSDRTENTYVDRTLFVMRPDGSGVRSISTEFDRRIRNARWAPDSSGVYFTAESEGTRDLYLAATTGGVRRITEGRHDLIVTDVGTSGTAVGVLSSPRVPSDIVRVALSSPTPERITAVNDDLLDGVALGEVEDFWYESTDGLRVQGWIIKPPDFDPSRKYPLFLTVHGGPHGMYDFGFDFSFQNFAANDYVVLYTNPRGSSGYGDAFGNGIENDYPGKDFDDLMHGVETVVDRGYVDPENLFIGGCSGGGTLAAWAVTQTDRFAAAVARCPITNWISFVGTTDGTSWYKTFAAFPWEDPSDHLRRSPLMHVANVTTPTLIMVGEYDLRTPVAQAEEFYVALKMQQVPTRLILMQEEWHGTTRKPSNFMRTQLYMMEWFEEYMSDGLKRSWKATDTASQ